MQHDDGWRELRCSKHPTKRLGEVRAGSAAQAFCRECNAFVTLDGSKVDYRRKKAS